MRKIYTHVNPDLDALASLWAVMLYLVGATEQVQILFCSANWDGAEMVDDDIAVDMEAGGRGWKGDKDPDGTVHSSFAYIVRKYAPEEDQRALSSLVQFIDAHDSQGCAIQHFIPGVSREVREVLNLAGLNTVLAAIKASCGGPDRDKLAYEHMSRIFNGMLKLGKSRLRSAAATKKAERFGKNGEVAILRSRGGQQALFNEGVKVVVYACDNNIGLSRNNFAKLNIPMNHPLIQMVVAAEGEKDWFAHDSGFLYCRGSLKAPATTKSKVDPVVLAKTMARIIDHHENS
jgi:hypothetical protein